MGDEYILVERAMKVRIKQVIKRGIILLSTAVLISVNGIGMVANADETSTEQDSKTLSRSMIQYFRTKNELDETCITNDEMRVFGAFISNFYVPYKTKVTSLSSDTDLKKKILDTFFGGDSSQEKTLDNLLKKLEESYTSNSEKLYKSSDGTGDLVDLLSLIYGDCDMYRSNGEIVYNKATSEEDLFRAPTLISLLVDVDSSCKYFENNGDKAASTNLKVSAFGDIITNDGIVVVPACLNPYTFYKTSDKNKIETLRLPLNNSFMMGNMLNADEVYNVSQGDSRKRTGEIIGVSGARKWIRDQINGGTGYAVKSTAVKDKGMVVYGYKGTSGDNVYTLPKYTHDYVGVCIPTTKEVLYSEKEENFLFLKYRSDTQEQLDDLSLNVIKRKENVIDTIGSFSSGTWGSDTNEIETYKLFSDAAGLVESPWTKYMKGDSDTAKGLQDIYNNKVGKNKTTIIDTWKTNGDYSISNIYAEYVMNNGKKYKGNNDNAGEVVKKNGVKYLSSQIYDNSGTGDSRIPKEVGGEFLVETLQTKNLGVALRVSSELAYANDVTNFYNVMRKGAEDFIGVNGKFVSAIGNSTTKYSDKSIPIADTLNVWGGIYWGYFYEILGIGTDSDGNMTSGTYDSEASHLPNLDIGLKYGNFNLADMLTGVDPVESEANELEKMQEDIIKKVYNLLDTSHTEYRDAWIKGVINDTVLSIHNSIVGSDFVGSIMKIGTGNSNSTYTGVMGYVTTPKLAELPFTSWLISNYWIIYIVIMILVLVVLIMMWVSSQKKWQEALALFVAIAFVMILPKTLIDGTIEATNLASENIYGDRFLFWALAQHQQADDELEEAGEEGSAGYALMSDLQDVENMTSDTGIRLKWMSPKKNNKLDTLLGNKMSNELTANTTIFRWLFSGIMQQETYVDDPLATYVYRPYNDLNTIAKDLSEELGAVKVNDYADINKTINSYYSISKGESGEKTKRESRTESGKFLKQLYSSPGNEYLTEENETVRGKSQTYSYITELFNSDLVNNAMYKSVLKEDASSLKSIGFSLDNANIDTGTNTYLLYSESPYYYFYNVFAQAKAQVKDESGKYVDINVSNDDASEDFSVNDFSHVLLSKDFFKVTNANSKNKYNDQAGYVRDFLNLEGLFTYVIPYLNYGNEYVQLWTQKYGANISDINYEDNQMYKDAADSTTGTEEAIKDKLHNDCLGQVWNMYSPWVDTLYDTGVYNYRIKTAMYDMTVLDTVNPDSYVDAGRPMSFSPADMHNKNLQESEITDIEYKINKTLEDTYEDLMYLNNYQGYDDEVLISAAAMIATFNFNKNFSSNNIVGEQYTLYPQSFEMKNMNYDAFLRLIIMNSTGEPLSSTDGSVYVRMLNKSSVFTGILMVAVDIVSVYVIPAAKIILLFGLMALSMIMILYLAFSPKDGLLKTVGKVMLLPLFLFGLLLVGMSLVISLFVGEGKTDIVGERGISVVTNDPAVTLLLLLLVDIVFIILMWKIGKNIFKSLKVYVPGLGMAALGAVTGAGLAVASRVRGTVSDIGRFGVNQTVGGAGRSRRYRKRQEELADESNDLQREANEIARDNASYGRDTAINTGGLSDRTRQREEEKALRDIDDKCTHGETKDTKGEYTGIRDEEFRKESKKQAHKDAKEDVKDIAKEVRKEKREEVDNSYKDNLTDDADWE